MLKIMDKMYFKGLSLFGKAKAALKDERGDTNIISIIVILAIVILLAIMFRKQLMALFGKIWNGISTSVDNATNNTLPE